ncbi:Alpha/beta hydrolase [Giardia muris]|uniref:Alpha/beta hydrolase n=1 Tax=Giardia muris TaxID=5742 RepID=A0A4Z1T2L1_GIAMU|nr:Alpha/beta hydrolase [Giardia muris]|eukprot:TNJ26819.1 Alpha/beta hydrolase [Giardia muris]
MHLQRTDLALRFHTLRNVDCMMEGLMSIVVRFESAQPDGVIATRCNRFAPPSSFSHYQHREGPPLVGRDGMSTGAFALRYSDQRVELKLTLHFSIFHLYSLPTRANLILECYFYRGKAEALLAGPCPPLKEFKRLSHKTYELQDLQLPYICTYSECVSYLYFVDLSTTVAWWPVETIDLDRTILGQLKRKTAGDFILQTIVAKEKNLHDATFCCEQEVPDNRARLMRRQDIGRSPQNTELIEDFDSGIYKKSPVLRSQAPTPNLKLEDLDPLPQNPSLNGDGHKKKRRGSEKDGQCSPPFKTGGLLEDPSELRLKSYSLCTLHCSNIGKLTSLFNSQKDGELLHFSILQRATLLYLANAHDQALGDSGKLGQSSFSWVHTRFNTRSCDGLSLAYESTCLDILYEVFTMTHAPLSQSVFQVLQHQYARLQRSCVKELTDVLLGTLTPRALKDHFRDHAMERLDERSQVQDKLVDIIAEQQASCFRTSNTNVTLLYKASGGQTLRHNGAASGLGSQVFGSVVALDGKFHAAKPIIQAEEARDLTDQNSLACYQLVTALVDWLKTTQDKFPRMLPFHGPASAPPPTVIHARTGAGDPAGEYHILNEIISSVEKIERIARVSRANQPKDVFIMAHGYRGDFCDLRLLADCLRQHTLCGRSARHPRLIDQPYLILAKSYQSNTLCSFLEMGIRLADEVVTSLEADSIAIKRLHFIGHSMGGLVIQACLATSRMEPYLKYLGHLVCLNSPLGGGASSNGLVRFGLKMMAGNKKEHSIKELLGGKVTRKLLQQVQPSYPWLQPGHIGLPVLEVLTTHSHLDLFKYWVLMSSLQDGYVDYFNALLLPQEATPIGNLLLEKARIGDVRIDRYLFNFDELPTILVNATGIDRSTGRDAHIAHLCSYELMLAVTELAFGWYICPPS